MSDDNTKTIKDYLKVVKDFLIDVPVIGGFLETKPKVTVLRFSGVLADSNMKRGALSYNRFSSLIDKAFDKGGVKAVALVINSPGGSAAQTSLIASHIRRKSEDTEIPVYAFIEDVAASGGYWLACAADEIYAQESSIVGSVGVISANFGFEDFIKRYDIHRRVYTAGKDKSFQDMFLPEQEKDVKRLKELQKNIHEAFKEWVQARRGDKITGKDSDLLEGQFWTALSAQEKGMIDGLGDVYSFMQEQWGENTKFIELVSDRMLPVPGFLSRLQYPSSSLPEEALAALEARSHWARFGL